MDKSKLSSNFGRCCVCDKAFANATLNKGICADCEFSCNSEDEE